MGAFLSQFKIKQYFCAQNNENYSDNDRKTNKTGVGVRLP